jgi:hypothetical protein
MLRAETGMDYGANTNVATGALNIYDYVHVWNALRAHGHIVTEGGAFVFNATTDATIQYAVDKCTMNFRVPGGQSGGSYFWFNQKILSADGFASSSLLSLKDIKGNYKGKGMHCQKSVKRILLSTPTRIVHMTDSYHRLLTIYIR